MNLLLTTTASAAILISLLAPTKVEIARTAVGTEATAYVSQIQGFLTPQGADSSVADVVAVVREILIREGVDVTKAEKIMFCESSFNEKAIGDSGDSLGLWQIRLKSHPTVTRECALSAECSTEYAVKLIKSSRSWNFWSCNNLI